jgi:hypothetical protein
VIEMSQTGVRTVATFGVLTAVAATLFSGCVYRREVVPAASPPTTVVITPGERVVNYPEGRWELRGAGTTTAPYYWVWVPSGAMPPNPPPVPRLPR